MRVINVFLLILVILFAGSIYNATVERDLAMNTIGKINDADYQYYESGFQDVKTIETPYGKFKTNSRCKVNSKEELVDIEREVFHGKI